MLKLIYYPNKFERYTAALRLLYQKLTTNNGIQLRYLNRLKKIYEFEAIQNIDITPINIEKLCGELLTAVLLKKKFDFYIKVENNYLLNKKAFISIILNICNQTNYMQILSIQQKLVIKAKFKTSKTIIRLLKVINGLIFKEIKSEYTYLVLNIPMTQKETKDFEKAYYLVQNPLSVVNLYLTD